MRGVVEACVIGVHCPNRDGRLLMLAPMKGAAVNQDGVPAWIDGTIAKWLTLNEALIAPTCRTPQQASS